MIRHIKTSIHILLVCSTTLITKATNIAFIENKGQIIDMEGKVRPDILFKADIGNAEVYLRKEGISYVLSSVKGLQEVQEKEDAMRLAGLEEGEIRQIISEMENQLLIDLYRIDMAFIGANKTVNIKTERLISGYNNYYLGHCPQGITQVKSFQKITQENVYKNIDVSFYGGKTGGLEYDFVVHPGGNPNDITIQYTGADKLELTEDGKLMIHTAIGNIMEWMPLIYQNTATGKIERTAKYILTANNIIKIEVGAYDKTLPLVIDPWCTWITYLGGTDQDKGHSITTDANGNVIGVGTTISSVGFPVSPGAEQTTNAGGNDAYIAKFDEAGIPLWITYLGGNAADIANDVAIYDVDDIIIAGNTGSGDFPTTFGTYDTVYAPGGAVMAFIARFDAAGNKIWATYYGGSDQDRGYGITSDSKGMIYLGGESKSTDLPTTASSFQDSLFNTGYDAYLTKFDATGNHIWSTYFGGNNVDRFYDIEIDGNDDIIGVGNSGSDNLPITPGIFQDTAASTGATTDGFIAKFDSTGNRLWATYYGSTALDYLSNVGIDADNNIYAGGGSTSPNFPVTPSAFQTIKNTGWDGVLVKFDESGNRQWATFFGGDNEERVNGIAVADKVYISGYTASTDLPVSPGAGQQTYNPGGAFPLDNYMASFDLDGNKECVTYIGGGERDEQEISGGSSITVFGPYAYITGNVRTGFYPVTSGAFQTTYGGGFNDAFISQIPNNCTNTIAEVDLGNDTAICPGDSLILDAGTVVSLYLWQDSSTMQTFRVDTVGTYFVRVSQNDSCFASDTIEVLVIPPPVADAGPDDSICSGLSVTLNASGGGTYNWTPSTGLSCDTCSNPTATPLTSTVYNLSVGNGACFDEDSVTIIVFPALVTNTGTDTSILPGDSSQLFSGGGDTYSWSPSSSLSCDTCLNPIAKPEQTTVYYVTITDSNGCQKVDSVEIIVIEIEPEVNIWLPNSFSPDNDGINDIFYILFSDTTVEIGTFILTINNRMGEVVFKTNDKYQEWDGFYNGLIQPAGTYTYNLEFEFGTKAARWQGNVTLVR